MACNMPFLAFNQINKEKELCSDDEEISGLKDQHEGIYNLNVHNILYFQGVYNQVDEICAKEMDETTKCKPECDQSSFEAKTKYYSQIGKSDNSEDLHKLKYVPQGFALKI